MTTSIAVSTSLEGYLTAVAELPLRTHLSDARSGAVVVVPGQGEWCDGVRAAHAAGAAAVVLAAPDPAPADAIDALIEDVAGLPVIVDRPLLRPDAAEDALAGRVFAGRHTAPRLITVDCAAPASDLAAATREAIGWLRRLSGGDLAHLSGDGGLALCEPEGSAGTLAAITIVQVNGVSGLRIHALGEVVTEVEVSAARTVVSTSTSAGRMTAPSRYESAERLSLRRALDAMKGGEPPADLRDLAKDAALVGQLSSARAHKHD